MRRRSLLAAITALPFAAPRLAHAQSSAPRPIVAFARIGPWSRPSVRESFIHGIREQGLEEGRDFDIAERFTHGDPSRDPAVIAELVMLNPAVIVVQTSGLAVTAKKATSTIPIVASTIGDPVGLGLAESIVHPGGNVTGLLAQAASPTKLLEMLRQIVPEVTRVGLLLNPGNAAHRLPPSADYQAQIDRLGITLVPVGAKTPGEIEAAFATLAKESVGALSIVQDGMFNQEIKRIADLALTARLPTFYGFRDLPDAGGLLSYGGSLTERARHMGWYTGKILNGDKPGDLPLEQLNKLELIINMKTAEALGLTIPPLILARADELIE